MTRSTNSELRGARQAVRGLAVAEDRQWLADRNAALLLGIVQQIPYEVQRPIDWDHIFPQAQASRMWALGVHGRRVHHRYRRLVQSAGNLWAMDAGTNRALQDTPPAGARRLLDEWYGTGQGHPVWPKERWFLDGDEVAAFVTVDGLLTDEAEGIDSAMNQFNQLVTGRADNLLNAAWQTSQAALFAADAQVAAADPVRYDQPGLLETLGLSAVMAAFVSEQGEGRSPALRAERESP